LIEAPKRLLTLIPNIRLGSKGLRGTNGLAYFVTWPRMNKKERKNNLETLIVVDKVRKSFCQSLDALI
jgi:hypothetical protein